MILMGNSGATINLGLQSVEKIGGRQDLMREVILLQTLGPNICPHVIGVLPGRTGYVMERCVPCAPMHSDSEYTHMFARIRGILKIAVWNRNAYYHNGAWKVQNLKWIAEYAPWIPKELITEPEEEYPCMTHGDPTLSNVLFRKISNEADPLLIGDPVPSRLGVPSHDTVDYGKLLQSCMGWEAVVSNGAWSRPSKRVLDEMIRAIPEPKRAASLFWGAYHCARIGVTALDTTRRLWGRVASEQLVLEAAQCSMPTI